MTQQTLFGGGWDIYAGPVPESLPYAKGSETSKAAAESMKVNAGTQRARVLDYLRGRGSEGATDEEIQDALDMNPSAERPRRGECEAAGLVFASGRTRATKSGRQATVWVATDNNQRSET